MDTLPLKCATQSLNILSDFPKYSSSPPHTRVLVDHINEEFPWDYFDGASQGTPSRGGVGGIIFLSPNHIISFKDRIGQCHKQFQ
jgi:hypothetical protein